MEIGQLKAFCKVAELKNFNEAAESLYLTQPAVSLKIQKLEASLNSKLFIRNNRSVKLSREGEVFLPFAKNILKAVSAAEYALEDIDQLNRGHITIGCSDTLAKYILLPLIKTFIGQYPNIEITLLNKTSLEIKKQFSQGLIDIAFLLDDEKPRSFEHALPWFEYRDCVLVNKASPLAKRKKISLKNLSSEKLILLEQSSTSRDLFNKACLIEGLQTNKVIEAGSVEMQKDMARIGLGLAVVPNFVFNETDTQGDELAKIDLSGLNTRKIKMYTQKQSKAEQALAKHLLA